MRAGTRAAPVFVLDYGGADAEMALRLQHMHLVASPEPMERVSWYV